MFMVWELEID